MRFIRTALSVLAASLTLTAGAVADPLVPAHSLAPAVERSIAAEIRSARAARPELFRRVQHLQGLDPAVYNTTRLQRPSVARELTALGPDALLPMLDTLLFSGYPATLDAEQRDALEVGLLEAIANLRDRRAEPALRAAFMSMTSQDAVRTAARGLGELCTDAEINLLTTEAQAATPRRDAALEGLGACRRAPSVRALIDALDRAADDRAVIAAAHGLANAGSSWAQTAHPTGDDVSAMAATALVRAFARANAATRNELQFAILSVGYPETSRLLREASSHTPDASIRERLSALDTAMRHAGITR